MIITGFHSIEEKLRAAGKAGKTKGGENAAGGLKLYYSKPGPRIKKILAAAKEAGISAVQTEDGKLDELVKGLDETLRDHRGLVMEIAGGKKQAENLVDFDAWVRTHSGSASNDTDAAADTPYTVVILDSITDPHNVGAIIRSCDQFGASLVVIPEHNSASDIAVN